MSYTPKSEQRLVEEGLLLPGHYDFEVVETSDKPSKKGNDMYTLKLHIFDESGSARVIMDYIALGSNFGERKLRHAAEACGIIDIYNTGNMVPKDFMGRCGKVDIKVQEGNAEFPLPKNVVADYVKRSTPGDGITPPIGATLDDDEIPF